jgi:hypothetical protein
MSDDRDRRMNALLEYLARTGHKVERRLRPNNFPMYRVDGGKWATGATLLRRYPFHR